MGESVRGHGQIAGQAQVQGRGRMDDEPNETKGTHADRLKIRVPTSLTVSMMRAHTAQMRRNRHSCDGVGVRWGGGKIDGAG